MGALVLVVLYSVFACIITLLPAGAARRRSLLIKNLSRVSRFMLNLLGVRVHVKHHERLRENTTARLVVANHLSYIDILVIAAVAPSVFITSVELGSTLVLGILARMGGSIFIERRRAPHLRREIPIIVRILQSGVPVTLFPEGTTSNGNSVQPFKNSFFQASILARTDILPLCLRYTGVNGEPLKASNRDLVFYYGDASFGQHFPRLLALTSLSVEVIPLKIIHVREGDSRKELAIRACDAISKAYQEESLHDRIAD
jgi:lyso-ornithine lipid O-acyltransferase